MSATVTTMPLAVVAERLLPLVSHFKSVRVDHLYVFEPPIVMDDAEGEVVGILVDYAPESRFSLFDMGRVAELVENQTGLTADVVTRGGLRPSVKPTIEAGAVKVF